MKPTFSGKLRGFPSPAAASPEMGELQGGVTALFRGVSAIDRFTSLPLLPTVLPRVRARPRAMPGSGPGIDHHQHLRGVDELAVVDQDLLNHAVMFGGKR